MNISLINHVSISWGKIGYDLISSNEISPFNRGFSPYKFSSMYIGSQYQLIDELERIEEL